MQPFCPLRGHPNSGKFMLSEEQLIEKCIQKDRKAQKLLFDRYSGFLLGVSMRYARNVPEAEDILQDAMVKIYQHMEDYSHRGSFTGWMKTVVVNTAINHYHREKKHAWHLDIEEVNETDVEGNLPENCAFTREELLGVIRSLPAGYRLIFNLYAIEGYKHREIAEMLGIDINTSKSQYSRARGWIRARLEKLARVARRTDNK